jgi:hypothetical protein
VDDWAPLPYSYRDEIGACIARIIAKSCDMQGISRPFSGTGRCREANTSTGGCVIYHNDNSAELPLPNYAR